MYVHLFNTVRRCTYELWVLLRYRSQCIYDQVGQKVICFVGLELNNNYPDTTSVVNTGWTFT